MTIPHPQHEDAQYQDPGPELDSASALAPHLLAPPPQFGRLPHGAPLREFSPAQVSLPGTSSRIPQPEPLAGLGVRVLGVRVIVFLIDYMAPVIALILLFCLGARTGSTAWRLVLAVVGVGLLGGGIWNCCHRPGATRRSLGRRVVRMTEHREPARKVAP
jgi:hypothetical protein